MKKLSTTDEIAVWTQLRSSINTWVSVSATLLTGGTAFFFAAFGVIFANNEKIGQGVSFLLTLGLFLGSFFLLVSVSHISQAGLFITEACMSIEDSLFGKEENIHKITNIVNRHPIWGYDKPIGQYFKLWALSLVISAGFLTIWRFLIWLAILPN
jgi:hypothetical protein